MNSNSNQNQSIASKVGQNLNFLGSQINNLFTKAINKVKETTNHSITQKGGTKYRKINKKYKSKKSRKNNYHRK